MGQPLSNLFGVKIHQNFIAHAQGQKFTNGIFEPQFPRIATYIASLLQKMHIYISF